MRKVINGVIVALLAGPALLLGQGGTIQDVQKVMADLRAALGGADKVAAVTTLTATGRTLRTNQSGATVESDFELAMALPDKYLMRTTVMNMGHMSIYRNAGFNGETPIDVIDQPPSLGGGGGAGTMVMVRRAGAVGGDNPTPEQQAENNHRMLASQKADFARLALGLLGSSYDSFPLQFTYAGEAEAADGKAHVVDVTGAGDFKGRLFVDQKTHLPLMFSWMALEPLVIQQANQGPGGVQTVQATSQDRDRMMADLDARRKEAEANRREVEYRVYYSNFRNVGGVKIPHTFQRSIDGKPTEEMTFDQIKVNPKIDMRKFDTAK